MHWKWEEVRTLVIGEFQPAVQEQGDRVVHTGNLSYFSCKVSAEVLTCLALVETHHRGVEQAAAVGAVMDGAEWEQGFVDYHRPDAVWILDFPHTAENITPVGEFVCGAGTPEMHAWVSEQLHRLKILILDLNLVND